MAMNRKTRAALRACTGGAVALLLAGCGASIPGLSTSALAPAKPAEAQNDPTSRALQVGSTSARAIKCGFNFDPVKLRTQYLAADTMASPADADKLGRIYDTAFNGVSKAVSGQGESYCSDQKVAMIKDALTRHLAGDYAPPPPAPAEEDDGIFGSFGSTSSGDSDYRKKMESNPTLGN